MLTYDEESDAVRIPAPGGSLIIPAAWYSAQEDAPHEVRSRL